MGFTRERNSARFLLLSTDNFCQSPRCPLVRPSSLSACCDPAQEQVIITDQNSSFLFLEPKSHRHNPLQQITKPILMPPTTKPPLTSPPASTSKIALMPPTKQALNPPPLLPPKPNLKPLRPLPPPKPPALMPLSDPELQNVNGLQDLPSPLRSPDSGDTVAEDGGAAPGGELEVGSMVEVNDPPLFGVIRWIGRIGGIPDQVAGIELVRQKLSFVAFLLYIFT